MNPSQPADDSQSSPCARQRSAPRSSSTLLIVLGALGLIALVFCIYGRALHAPLIFDDDATIVKNPSIFHLWPLVGSGETGGPLNPTKNRPTSARPLVNLSFAINYHFGGVHPTGYHAVNIGIHALSALLLWAIVWRILLLDCFGGRFEAAAGFLSFAAALVWALHPLNTESVAYITQRTESLMGFFYLVVMYASLRYFAATSRFPRAVWLIVAGLAGLCGMLSKEMMASAIAMVLLLERTFIRGSLLRSLRASWPLYVALALSWLPILAINYHGPRTPLAGFHLGVPAYVWWLTQTKAVLVYLKLTFWPWPLVIHYEVPYLQTLRDALPSLIPVAALILATVLLVWRRTSLGFVLAWFFAVLSPTLLIPLPGETLVERRMYVPLMAIVPLIVVGLYAAFTKIAPRSAASDRPRLRLAWAISVFLLAATFAGLTYRRLGAYQSELAIWEDAVQNQPHDPLVQVNLGTALAQVGRASEASEHFEKALSLGSEDTYARERARAHFNLGDSLAAQRQFAYAVPHFESAVRLEPEDFVARFNLAQALIGLRQPEEAIKHLQIVVDAHPEYAAAQNDLGVLLADAGRATEALPHLEEAVRLEPHAGSYISLLRAYALLGRTTDTVTAWTKAIALARAEGQESLASELEARLAGYRAATAQP